MQALRHGRVLARLRYRKSLKFCKALKDASDIRLLKRSALADQSQDTQSLNADVCYRKVRFKISRLLIEAMSPYRIGDHPVWPRDRTHKVLNTVRLSLLVARCVIKSNFLEFARKQMIEGRFP